MNEKEKGLEIVTMINAYARALSQDSTEVLFTETGHFVIVADVPTDEPAVTEPVVVRRMTVGGTVEAPIW